MAQFIKPHLVSLFDRKYGGLLPAEAGDESNGRTWCLTWNNYTDDDVEYLKRQLNPETSKLDIVYSIHCKEVAPTTATPHIHAYFRTSNTERFSRIRRMFSRCHIMRAGGTAQDNFNYITKEDEHYVEYGERPDTEEEKQGLLIGFSEIYDMYAEPDATADDFVEAWETVENQYIDLAAIYGHHIEGYISDDNEETEDEDEDMQPPRQRRRITPELVTPFTHSAAWTPVAPRINRQTAHTGGLMNNQDHHFSAFGPGSQFNPIDVDHAHNDLAALDYNSIYSQNDTQVFNL